MIRGLSKVAANEISCSTESVGNVSPYVHCYDGAAPTWSKGDVTCHSIVSNIKRPTNSHVLSRAMMSVKLFNVSM